jgi:viroplasmin and RNaseH domain-containing protein
MKERRGSGPHMFTQPKNVLPKYRGGRGCKVYAVRRGYVSGLYYNWDECSHQVKGFSGTEFWGFRNQEEALAWLRN